MNFSRCCIVFAALFFIGCGGTSNTNRFQQMAEARAARNRADKADEEKKRVVENEKPVVASPVKATAAERTVVEIESSARPKDPSHGSTVPQQSASKSARKATMQISHEARKVAHLGDNKVVGVYDVENKTLIRKIYNPYLDPFSIAIGKRGNQMVVGGTDGSFKTFSLDSINGLDRFQQDRLQRKDFAAPRKGHESVVTAVAIDETSNLVATGGADGILKLWNSEAAVPSGEVKAGVTPIVSLHFHRRGKYLLSSDIGGKVLRWNCPSLSEPCTSFNGMDASILHSAISPDGRYIAAVYEDAEHSVYVWEIDAKADDDDGIEASCVVRNGAPSSSAAFTSDSTCLLIGGSDGLIRAWNVNDDREVARFKGHSGNVADISAASQPGHFVSGGIDQSVRSWHFPSSLAASDVSIPHGKLTNRQQVGSLSVPSNVQEISKEDPLDAARQALISGASTTKVLELMNVADDVKRKVQTAIASVMRSEEEGSISAKDLSQRRRQLTRSQEGLVEANETQNMSTFTDGFSNLSFVGSSNFKFGLEKKFRPVQLLLSDRYLYAALASDKTKKKKRKEGEPEIDYGDNGALLSWDYKFSRLQAHAWSIDDLEVSELVALPRSASVLTVPQMMLFSQDGSSQLIGNVASWAVREQSDAVDHFLAVGSAGAIRQASDILTIFKTDELSKDHVSPYSKYRSYEGVVTAMAFANNSQSIAFCVRERAVHRLFIADTQTLQLRKLEEVNHSNPWLQGGADGQSAVRNTGAAVGISTLAFSPDDKMLVAHGQYSGELYKFSRWDLAWDGGDLIDFRKSRRELTSEEGPFFDDSGNEPIKFMSRPLQENERDPGDPNWRAKRTAGPSPKIIVRNRKGFHVVNLNSARAERVIPFLDTQQGVPQYAISDDGRWLAMGDDNGKAFVYDLNQGDYYGVTIDSKMEAMIADSTQARPEILNRPAHLGPVVGVTFSKADIGRDYPAFVATFGEENKVKVWELYPILDPKHGLRSRHWVPRIKSAVRSSTTRRRNR